MTIGNASLASRKQYYAMPQRGKNIGTVGEMLTVTIEREVSETQHVETSKRQPMDGVMSEASLASRVGFALRTNARAN